MKINNLYEYEQLAVSFRRELHKNPELSLKEYKTCEFIINTLKDFGIQRVEKVFNTGVVAVLGDEKNECIGIRCDTDALPIKEETNLPFKSQNEGVMHACAHDGHTAVVLALAKILKDNENDMAKCVKLIFQPGEETDGGAKPMIEEGALMNPDVSCVYGFHLWNNVDCGKACYTKGVSFAAASRFEIKIKGKGGHGAMPEKVVNSLIPASRLINSFSKINDNYKNAVVSLCSCNSDGSHNVFCETVVLKGTIRTIDKNDYDSIVEEILKFEGIVENDYNCECDIKIIYEYPCLKNDDETLFKLVESSKKVLGEENVFETDMTYAAEDFSFFTENTKAAHIKIGISNKNRPETLLPLHNPKFDIDERALSHALRILAELC